METQWTNGSHHQCGLTQDFFWMGLANPCDFNSHCAGYHISNTSGNFVTANYVYFCNFVSIPCMGSYVGFFQEFFDVLHLFGSSQIAQIVVLGYLCLIGFRHGIDFDKQTSYFQLQIFLFLPLIGSTQDSKRPLRDCKLRFKFQ